MTTVGTIVLAAATILSTGILGQLDRYDTAEPSRQLLFLLLFFTACFAVFVPFDLLGGLWLPTRFGRSTNRLRDWLSSYAMGVIRQIVLYVLIGYVLMYVASNYGLAATLGCVVLSSLLLLLVRDAVLNWTASRQASEAKELATTLNLVRSWGIEPLPITVRKHQDEGYTGGVVGMGRWSRIVIPLGWLSFSREQLAVVIARRTLSVRSGLYWKGVLAALMWNIGGLAVCLAVSASPAGTLAWLVEVICWFTLWSFAGLLILPTASRHASLRTDQLLAEHGVDQGLILAAADSLVQLQDGERARSVLIETIFHPIPSVQRRGGPHPPTPFAAWHLARTTLFLSWSCLGLLARAVHCNVGRPELWAMPPSD